MPWIDFSISKAKRLGCVILDNQQHKVRNTALNAHALVRGSAGSGKSLILRHRLERILQEPIYGQILVLTYNRFMAGWMTGLIAGVRPGRVLCSTFNKWASNILHYDYRWGAQAFFEIASSSLKRYDAILIDEAQDFEDEWFMGLLQMINPQTNSLFLVYDNAQSVYKSQHRRRSDWTWSRLGINVVGRAEILDLCYRCSPEIVNYSWSFIKPFLDLEDIPISRRNVGGVVEPRTSSKRSSGVPVSVFQCSDAAIVAREVYEALKTEPSSSIAIMMHPEVVKIYQPMISDALQKLGVPHHAPMSSETRKGNIVTRPCVVVDSWNALKGVEFDAAILFNSEYVGEHLGSTEKFRHIAGLYAAMTRARDHLIVTYINNNEFSMSLQMLCRNAIIANHTNMQLR
ncbi:UvrD-helicase domain-containing protein [Desulfobacter curvatus]|uniref:UvrD-helicase domain-containing protein n=1 Tax=Desulfobacter curvatus TaxID=2290 RepID=UPI00036D4DFF|nr:UvrD-helicase domain-containing protein [Desulfobacter curvatus]